MEHMLAVIMTVQGRVQGVGFRWWALGEARYLGLSGYAEIRPMARWRSALRAEPRRSEN